MTTGSNAIIEFISKAIHQHGGLLSFADYMEIALYHPTLGYYNSEAFDIGKHGDFTTAPEITPLFAKCYARQYQQLQFDHILELGAGTGRFAGDILIELEKLNCLPSHYFIYEISHALRQKQLAILQSEYPSIVNRVSWLEQLPEKFSGLIIANEVLDALPVHCFKIENDMVKERCVAWDNELVWKVTTPQSSLLAEKVEILRQTYDLANGYESEINLLLPKIIQSVSTMLVDGVILFTDYGYGQREYYRSERNHGTLTCFRQHQRNDLPLQYPSEQDITAHVDFTSVIENAVLFGCELAGYTTQASFLLGCGLTSIVEQQTKNLSMADEFTLHQTIKRLTMPMEMGETIKVMGLAKNVNLPLIGFKMGDRSLDLG